MKSFLKLVEIQTKVASVLPLIFGVLFAAYRYQRFDLVNTLVFALALLCLDMGVTALNNYMDFSSARRREGYNYKEHNAIVRDNLSVAWVRMVVAGLFLLAAGLGLLLVFRTDVWVLLMGALAFCIGIAYSFGPVPLSRTPLGEVASGLTMGFGIFVLAVYIQLDAPAWFAADLVSGRLALSVDLTSLGMLFIWSLPFVLGIGGIMLANNTCDMEDDQANGRSTLSLIIGKTASLWLMVILYVLAFSHAVFMVVAGYLPWYAALVLVPAFVPVALLLRPYLRDPVKGRTFVNAVKAYILLAIAWIVALTISLLSG